MTGGEVDGVVVGGGLVTVGCVVVVPVGGCVVVVLVVGCVVVVPVVAGVPPSVVWTTSRGAFRPSLLERLMFAMAEVVRPKLYEPLPVTTDVTSTWVHTPTGNGPEEPTTEASIWG